MIDFEKGIVNRGNWHAIRQVFAKASKGLPVTVGFLGGSITQGSLQIPSPAYWRKPELRR